MVAVNDSLTSGLPSSVPEAATLGNTETLASEPGSSKSGDGSPPRTLGRYRIDKKLGHGGMGIVYAAFDPELEREVALKVLKFGYEGEIAHARLRREARTLAKLAHPNVVAVHDVGEEQGQLYLAMELLEGGTLSNWLRAVPRTWPEILAMFAAAGRGLVAAHEAGLVHRDFKPDNVLIDELGKPRVVDFGLARVVEDAPEPVDTLPGASDQTTGGDRDQTRAASQDLTRPGAVMGTPAYMAPEQHLGDQTDARTDQFSFCVALWEALYGERPFPGGNLAALTQAVLAGRVSIGPSRGVPRAIRTALLRGLEVDPRRRFASLAQLLDTLEAVPRRRRMVAISGVAATLGFGLIGATWVFADQPTSEAAPACVDTAARVDAIWTDARRAEINDALSGEAVARTRILVLAGLDDHADALAAGFEEACLDTEVRQLISPELRDRRVSCLVDRLDAFAATTELLARLERADLRQATRLVQELPAVERCADLEYLAARLPDPEDPDAAAAVAHARRELATANADITAVRIDDAEAALIRASAAVARIEHPPLAVELEFARARVLTLRGQYEQAAKQIEDAYHHAFAIGHDDVATDASLELMLAIGLDLGEPEQALTWARHAESLIERSGNARAEARLLDARGKMLHRLGESEQAVALFEQALALRRREFGPRSSEVASSLNDLSNALDRLGRRDEARKVLAEAIEIKLETLGDFSTSTAGSLTNMGMLLWKAGEYEAAIEHHQHALKVFERAYGPAHRSVAGTSLNLAKALHSAGRGEEALPVIERGLAIVRAGENDAAGLEVLLVNIQGGVYEQLRRWDDAREAYSAELALLTKMHGEQAPELASALLGLAEVANGAREYKVAIEHARRVLALQPADEPEWDQAMDAHLSLAEAQLGLGKRDEARAHAVLARDGFAKIGGRREGERGEAEGIIAAIDAGG
jgi:tetratricopeptide (TPR) repeat protein